MIPLSEPNIIGNAWKYVKECLDTGWVSSAGPFVGRFEAAFAEYAGARQAVAVANGTAGLHVALQLVGVELNDEVIVSNMTFVASANAIRYRGAHPVFADSSPAHWQMDADKVARFLESSCEMRSGTCINRTTGRRVRAILPVHILGSACPIDRLVELARSYGLAVVEDAAEAAGVRYRGRQVGTFGDIGVFSFNGNKLITAGSGGMLVTDNERLAAYARYLSTQARDDASEYIHNEVGYNYRLTSIQAALGLAQLEQIEEFIAHKRRIAKTYTEALANESITTMPVPQEVEPTFWLYTILLPEGTTVDGRKRVLERLKQSGVDARPFWHPIHGLHPYRDCQAIEIDHSVRLYERGISLPCSVGLKDDDLAQSIRAFKQATETDAVFR